MKYATLLLLLLASCKSSTSVLLSGNGMFEGKIVYRDASGKVQNYFIDATHYKSVNRDGKYLQLYHASNNRYYTFNHTQKTVGYLDAGFRILNPAPAPIIDGVVAEIPPLPRTERQVLFNRNTVKILDYDCTSVRIVEGGDEVEYFYTPLVRIDKTPFLKHDFGDWALYITSSEGALPLKYIIRKNGREVSSTTAVNIVPLDLNEADFELPNSYQLRNIAPSIGQ